jgi:hypothetical protein
VGAKKFSTGSLVFVDTHLGHAGKGKLDMSKQITPTSETQIRSLISLAMLVIAVPGAVGADLDTITLRGCPFEGAEPGCLGLEARGQQYDISTIMPKPRLHYLGIEITGRLSNPTSTSCKISNTPLQNIHWNGKYLRQKCK